MPTTTPTMDSRVRRALESADVRRNYGTSREDAARDHLAARADRVAELWPSDEAPEIGERIWRRD